MEDDATAPFVRGSEDSALAGILGGMMRVVYAQERSCSTIVWCVQEMYRYTVV